MDFEWSLEKEAGNLAKHGVDFSTVPKVYSEEPLDDGWKFDAKAKPLDARQRRAMGISEIHAPGATYHREESAKGVRLRAERGGARPGAGRKNKGHVRLQLLVPPATRAKIERIAASERISLSEAVSRAVAKA